MPAHALFFPAAAAYAAASVPASVAAMLGAGPAIPGLAFPAGHAHELLFGFALAAVAGNQLGPTPRPVLALLLGLWLAARVAFLAAPMHVTSAVLNGAFAATLAWQIAPRAFGHPKKLRNRSLPVTVVALCIMGAITGISLHAGPAPMQQAALVVAILLLGLLMLFMGGRIIAPAAAGQAYREGGNLAARVQPRLEGTLIAAMFLAIAAAAAGALALAGAAVAVAGVVALVRMARWRLWTLRTRPDLVCLGLGYGWLAVGLFAVGVALVRQAHLVTALHLVTVGAIGTLTVNVMALTWLRLARRDPARAVLPVWSTALVAVAVVARVAADFVPERGPWLAAAAGSWSAAYVLLLALFSRVRRAPPRER